MRHSPYWHLILVRGEKLHFQHRSIDLKLLPFCFGINSKIYAGPLVHLRSIPSPLRLRRSCTGRVVWFYPNLTHSTTQTIFDLDRIGLSVTSGIDINDEILILS
ncbi:hypothetical protein HN51_052028 [Arachis hypogaea]